MAREARRSSTSRASASDTDHARAAVFTPKGLMGRRETSSASRGEKRISRIW